MHVFEGAGDLAAAKLYATEAAARAADQAVQLHGGRGYSSAYPAERLLRDIMGDEAYEGSGISELNEKQQKVLETWILKMLKTCIIYYLPFVTN